MDRITQKAQEVNMELFEKLHKLKKITINNIKSFYRDYFTIDGTYTSILPSKIYLKKLYESKTGKKLDLNNPTLFNEKLNWLKLYNKRPEYTVMADKYLVRKFVSDRIGEKYLVPLLAVYDRAEEIDFDNLPNQFVLKCNHDSEVVICKDKENNDFQCKKGKFRNTDEVKTYLKKRLSLNYYKASREWPYKNIPRKIICEKFMVAANNKGTLDYKFLCFNGKAKLIAVYGDRFAGQLKEDYYSVDWEYLQILNKKTAGDVYEKPECFDEMLEIAETLSAGVPMLRVDFNIWQDMLSVGELTFFHHGGMLPFCDEWELKMGEWIELPEKSK